MSGRIITMVLFGLAIFLGWRRRRSTAAGGTPRSRTGGRCRARI